jgi:hypothetical protein
MTATEINSALQEHLGKSPGFDAAASAKLSQSIADAVATVAPPGGGTAQCYQKCQAARDAAMAACALKGWPLGAICIAQAVLAFNACRHACDSAS